MRDSEIKKLSLMKGVFLMTKRKIPQEQKIEWVRMIADGEISAFQLSRIHGISESYLQYCVALYKEHGVDALINVGTNNSYPPELKTKAVLEYLDGKGSYQTISVRYGLRSSTQLKRWVKMYNEGKIFKRIEGGPHMAKARRTTQEERISIVKDCIENGLSCTEAAGKHKVSYQQVYTWLKKYREMGEAGLEDRRGRRKADQKPRTELEELKIKMAKLEHELYLTKVERDLLKKVDELERKERYRR